jgi:hypothetical protein
MRCALESRTATCANGCPPWCCWSFPRRVRGHRWAQLRSRLQLGLATVGCRGPWSSLASLNTVALKVYCGHSWACGQATGQGTELECAQVV